MNKPNAIHLILTTLVILLVAGVAALKSHQREQEVGTAPEVASNVPASYSSGTVQPTTQLPRLVELGGEKCIPCMKMAPVIEELQKEYAGRVDIEKIDVGKDSSAVSRYAVRLIPTQVFLKADGQEFWRNEGILTKEQIVAKFVEMGIK